MSQEMWLLIAFFVVFVVVTFKLFSDIRTLKAWDNQSLVWAKKAIAWIQKREGIHDASGNPTTTDPPEDDDLPKGHA